MSATDYTRLAQAAGQNVIAFEATWDRIVDELRDASAIERGWRLAELQRAIGESEGDRLAAEVVARIKSETSR